MTARVTVTALSDVGSRKENEDFAVLGSVCPGEVAALGDVTTVVEDVVAATVVAVVDGLGGHAGGAEASAHLGRFLHAHRASASSEPAVAGLLTGAADALWELVSRPGAAWMAGAGATVAGLAVTGDEVIWFNVGDARAYLRDSGYTIQLSIDDSPGGPEGGSRTSVVLQSIGGTREPVPIVPHLGTVPVRHGDRFLLCTDGLTDVVDVRSIGEALRHPAEEAVATLVALALAGGGDDNVTVVVVDVAEVDDPLPPVEGR